MIGLSLFLAATLSGSAPDVSRWIEVASNPKAVEYWDWTSVRTVGAWKSAWWKIINHGHPGETRALRYYDCAGRNIALKSLTTYSADGTPTTTTFGDWEIRWDPAVPDTMGEAELMVVCATGGN